MDLGLHGSGSDSTFGNLTDRQDHMASVYLWPQADSSPRAVFNGRGSRGQHLQKEMCPKEQSINLAS